MQLSERDIIYARERSRDLERAAANYRRNQDHLQSMTATRGTKLANPIRRVIVLATNLLK